MDKQEYENRIRLYRKMGLDYIPYVDTQNNRYDIGIDLPLCK